MNFRAPVSAVDSKHGYRCRNASLGQVGDSPERTGSGSKGMKTLLVILSSISFWPVASRLGVALQRNQPRGQVGVLELHQESCALRESVGFSVAAKLLDSIHEG
jgi:hypothetical protein